MGEIRIERDDTRFMVWGWAAVLGLGSLGIAALILSVAIGQAILILSGCGGFGMVVLSIGKVLTWWKLADAESRRAEALLTEAKSRYIQARRGGYFVEER